MKAFAGAMSGQSADQWREYFYAEALSVDELVVKGQKRVSSRGRSSNTEASENIISNGSTIAVNDGQCMIIVEQGRVVELSAEPGEYVYDSSTEPSIFYGGLGKGILKSLTTIGRRVTFGGDTAKDQRIYYFNTKEIVGNKFGTSTPIPFRLVDNNIGLDVDLAVRCNGEYSYRLIDPVRFYVNISGNIERPYRRSELNSQLRMELLTALQPAFAQISKLGVRYSEIPANTAELAGILDRELTEKWHLLRGIAVVSIGFNSISISDEDEEMIKGLQKAAVMRDTTMAAASLVDAQADAMRLAGSNDGGAMAGFIGMGMAQQAGGTTAKELYALDSNNAGAKTSGGEKNGGSPEAGAPRTGGPGGAGNSSGSNGGGARTSDPGSGNGMNGNGTNSTGMNGTGMNGTAGAGGTRAPLFRCDKCGWTPADPFNPPNFCPDCGDRFDFGDVI
jgi:membrane protease subunit (stomatin/prohibitin family)